MGILYRLQGQTSLAKQMYQSVLDRKEKVLGPDHTSTLETVSALEAINFTRDKIELAERWLQRAFQGKREALGSKNRSTLDS
jgi:hypothetical protein